MTFEEEACNQCGHLIFAGQAFHNSDGSGRIYCSGKCMEGVALFMVRGPKDDSINHPSHYTQHPSKVECIQITEHMSFCLGNAIKYVWRADLKGGEQDLEKAIWYLERELMRRRKKSDAGS